MFEFVRCIAMLAKPGHCFTTPRWAGASSAERKLIDHHKQIASFRYCNGELSQPIPYWHGVLAQVQGAIHPSHSQTQHNSNSVHTVLTLQYQIETRERHVSDRMHQIGTVVSECTRLGPSQEQ